MADFEPFFELKNQYRESCPVLLQSGALYREEPTASAEAEETETGEATLPAEQEEAASPRTFLRLAFRNIDPRAVTSVYIDIHIFDKATNELTVVRDRRYLVPILGRDAVFGADEEIDVDDAAYSFSVAIKKVQFEGEDVFWNGSASLLFENLPEQAKIADVMEDEDLRAQYQRDFTEMAEDKEAAAQFVPQEYKDLWMCACGEVNHKDEEKCAACGAEYGPQHALFEDEEKLKENLEAYNKAEAEKAEAARIAAEKKAAEEKAAAEAAARKAAEEKAAAEEAARKKRLHRKIFLSVSIPLAVLIAAFAVVLIVYIIPQNHYNDAAALLEAGKYDEAITAFTALDGYSDSAARITEAEYKKACDLLENEKFAEAIEAFTALGDYEDSKDRITEAEYRRAVKTFESGAYEDALNLLEPLKDYKDAAEKIETCHYELGMKALEADNLKSAAAHFKEVNAEQNKKMQAAFCDKGIAFYEKGDEEKALTYFEYVTDKDFLPKIDAAYYAQALKLVEDGEYDKATEIFAKLGEYEDCPTQLLRIHALKAEQYYNNADTSMEMYGIITGIVIPFLLFPATITNSLSTMLLPSISYACAKRDTEAIKKALVSSALFCIMLGSFACILYILFAKPICTFAFESAEAGTLLQLMGFLCPFIYLSTTLSSVMNAIGYATQNLIYNILGISVRILCIIFFVPHFGIHAYICGMFCGYLLHNILTITKLASLNS